MAEANINIPAGWSRRLDDTPDTRSVATFEYRTAADTKFILTIAPQTERPGYTLHLTTRTPGPTQPAHEYHVRTYGRRKHHRFIRAEYALSMQQGSVYLPDHSHQRSEYRGCIQQTVDWWFLRGC